VKAWKVENFKELPELALGKGGGGNSMGGPSINLLKGKAGKILAGLLGFEGTLLDFWKKGGVNLGLNSWKFPRKAWLKGDGGELGELGWDFSKTFLF